MVKWSANLENTSSEKTQQSMVVEYKYLIIQGVQYQ